MSMLVARMEKKNTQNLGGMQKHNQREFKNHSNKEIDVSRSHLNYDLVNAANIDYREKIMGIIESQKTGTRAIRKDAVLVNEWIITSDQDFFKDMLEEDRQDFFKHATEWFKERYGEQNIAFANVHLDETTPHMHLGVVPMRDGRLQAKNVFNRTELLKVQEELPKYLQSKSFGIERGVEGSKTKHLTVPEYKEMKREIESLEEDKDKTLSEFIELAIIASEVSDNTKVLEDRKRALEAENGRLEGITEKNKNIISKQVEEFNAEKEMMTNLRRKNIEMSKIPVVNEEKREGFSKKRTGRVIIRQEDWEKVKALAVTGEAFQEENKQLHSENCRFRNENEQLILENEKLNKSNKSYRESNSALWSKTYELENENNFLKYHFENAKDFIRESKLYSKFKEFTERIEKRFDRSNDLEL